MDRWRNKVAIVTGASSGIGAATCRSLVENGMIVVGLARRAYRIEKLSEELQNQPGKLHAFECDLTLEENILRAFEWTVRHCGPVSVLINNAGITLPSTLAEGKTEDWRKIMDLNVMGLCICTREALKQMNEHGHIIHVNSIVGHYVPHIPLSIYPASKHAVTALTEALRQEMTISKKSIKVSSVSPGLVRNEFMNGLTDEVKTALSQPETAALESENVAEAIVFVLSTPPSAVVTELTIRPLGEPY